MKKSQTLKMTTLCVALLLSAPIVNIGFHVNASIGVDELDMLFQTTLEGILDREKVKETVISAKKDMIYDINAVCDIRKTISEQGEDFERL